MRPLLLLLLLPAACATPTTPDGRYVGTATPAAPAAPSDVCRASHASLRLREGQALFVPDETTWTLTGTAQPGGAVQAERTGGADKKPYATRFAGTWTLGAVTGTYTTPRCAYTVELARQ